jgi:SAM-dependent methyltransferase
MVMSGPALLDTLAALAPAERDHAIEECLGIAAPMPSQSPPGEHLLGYHPAGIAQIVRALAEVPVVASDVVVDLGAGLGKFVLVTRLLTGATARGIEIQPDLVARARWAAQRLQVDVRFCEGDARTADLSDGTVFFLYLPFTGPALVEVLDRLHDVAKRRAIVVCALAIDLDRVASWLKPRLTDAFWLTIYDSVVPGVSMRKTRGPAAVLGSAAVVAYGRNVRTPIR